jgi:hypothetical protein
MEVVFCVGIQHHLRFCLGNKRVGWTGEDSHVFFLGNKLRGEVFSHYEAVAVKCHSSIWDWLFGLPGRILCEQSPWYQRIWWAYSWLRSSPVEPFLVLVSDFPCTAHAFLLKHLSNHCQGLRCNFSKILTKFDAVLLSDLLQNCIRPDRRL